MGDGVLGLVLVARDVPEEEPSLVEAVALVSVRDGLYGSFMIPEARNVLKLIPLDLFGDIDAEDEFRPRYELVRQWELSDDMDAVALLMIGNGGVWVGAANGLSAGEAAAALDILRLMVGEAKGLIDDE
ncbi:hypothetical protein COO72_00725 [Bifidobacterium callitrichos]|nr:hypothetical protein COO72_00725 [Bifidobacterium callitrichos]